MSSIHSSNSTSSSESDFVTKGTFELLGKEDKSAGSKAAGSDHMERLHELSGLFLDYTADCMGAIFTTTSHKTDMEWKYGIGTSVKRQESTTTLRKKKPKEGLRKEIPGRENEAMRGHRLQKEGINDRPVLAKLDGLVAEERGIIEESIRDPSMPHQDERDVPLQDETDQEFATRIGNRLVLITVCSQSSRSESSPKKKEKSTASESLSTHSASLRSATSGESRKETQRTRSLEELSPEIDVAPIPKLITTISSHSSSLNEHTSNDDSSFGYTTNDESAMWFPMTSPATPAMAKELTSPGETSQGYTSEYSSDYTSNEESTLGYTANRQQVYYRSPTRFSGNEVSDESARGVSTTSPAIPAPMAKKLISHGETSQGSTSGYSSGYESDGESTLGYTANGQQVCYRPPAKLFSVKEVSPHDDDIGFTSDEGMSNVYTTQGRSTSASNIAPLARLRPRFRPQTILA